jgi:hypothetical protein
MKKFSFKIIAIFLLAITLWSGVAINGYLDSKIYIGEIEKVCAQGEDFGDNYDPMTGEQQVPDSALTSTDTKPSWVDGLVQGAADLITGALGKTIMMIQGIVLQILAIPILATLLRIVAAMLDLSIKTTLSTKIFESTGAGVVMMWSVVRNICNITFIFILLWSSIQLILGIASGNTKKMVANVIIAALLINFSFFITRIIIDAGNILAFNLYKNINPTGLGFDQTIINTLGLTGILEMSSVAGSVFSIAFGVISWLQVITILVALIVFIYAMLLMATRIVMLIFLVALSPIGFMGNVLPKLAEYAKLWRETLYGQVMIAPVFLFFVYLIIEVASAFNTLNSATDIPETSANTSGLTGLNTSTVVSGVTKSSDYMAYFKYVMIILLLIVAVKITKKMTGEIGKMVEKFGGMALGAALGLATGGAALAMRQTLGREATNKLNGEYGKDLRAKADTGDRVAQAKLKSLELASKSSFDFRNSKAGKLTDKSLGKLGGAAGLPISGLGKGGGIYSKDGKQTGFAGAQQAEQEKANKAYNDANKGVSAADRVAARDALERRRVAVENNLQGNTTHGTAVTELNRMKNEGIAGNQEIIEIERDIAHAQQKIQTGTAVEKQEARKELAAANKARAEKEKELITKNEEKYKDDIAEQNKIIKEETRKAQIDVERNMVPDDKRKIARVERARNLAQAMREGKVGIAGIIRSKLNPERNAKLAGGMESQKEKTEAELLREEMQEMRREARDAAKNKP